MRKKLDTRFPAARIKKIMQADEDVGKIAMAVPLLVSKALELFLQDLCDRTYDVTLKRGAKTLNSLHLKQCVQTFNVFDFLRDIVNKVPDLGGSDAAGENCSVAKRRKVEEEDDGSEDETKKKKIVLESDASHNSNNVRFRGRGRGRGRGRSSRTEKETSLQFEKSDAGPEISKYHDESQDNLVAHEAKKISPDEQNMEVPIRDFDLNVDLDENGDTRTTASADYARSPVKPASEITQGEYPGWSLSEMEKMAIHPIHLASISGRLNEEEDYDEEG